MYCIRTTTLDRDDAEINIKKCKEISKSVVKKELQFESYLNVLQTGKSIKNNQVGLRSDMHQIYTTCMRKT